MPITEPVSVDSSLLVRPRAAVEKLRAYAAPSLCDRIDLRLDANEGPSPDPAVLGALEAVPPMLVRRYPSKAGLEALIAGRHGVQPDGVIVTAGGDDAIDRCCRVVLEPGRTLLLHAPTFEMIERSARLAGADLTEIDWNEGPFPADRLIEALDDRTAMVAIVSPNNPTGLAATPGAILDVAAAAPRALVLVDLAYVEFADADPTAMLLQAPNIAVVRTFSKAAGMAGLRLGYALGCPQVIDWLRRVGGPYPVSGPSLAAAEALLRLGGVQGDYIPAVRKEREALGRLLVELGLAVLPSQANFVLARVPEAGSAGGRPLPRAEAIHTALRGRGISVRIFPGNPRLAQALRITCPGEDQAFRRLCRELRSVMEELAS
jgi:histidinol-phosphate aminotransferase